MQRKLARAVQMIAEKANLKYPSFRELRHAFRWVDLSKDGKVTRDEVENFFRVFAVPIETAEYLFVLFDAEDSDEINHSDFVEVFGPAMGIGHQEPSCKKQIELPGKRDLEREINDIMRIMASHMLKFAHPREALRSLDLSHDGRITRNELRAFFQRFGVEHTSADHVFDLLHLKDDVHDDLETCSYQEFINLFDPVMQPAHYEENGYIQDC
jgi:Ca2+-binding EF-hand superfamily protein